MSTLSNTRGHSGFTWPRLTWRRVLGRLVALDALYRERADLAAMDAHMLRDIGVTRSDIDGALRRPDEHLRLILMRGRHQIQH